MRSLLDLTPNLTSDPPHCNETRNKPFRGVDKGETLLMILFLLIVTKHANRSNQCLFRHYNLFIHFFEASYFATLLVYYQRCV